MQIGEKTVTWHFSDESCYLTDKKIQIPDSILAYLAKFMDLADIASLGQMNRSWTAKILSEIKDYGWIRQSTFLLSMSVQRTLSQYHSDNPMPYETWMLQDKHKPLGKYTGNEQICDSAVHHLRLKSLSGKFFGQIAKLSQLESLTLKDQPLFPSNFTQLGQIKTLRCLKLIQPKIATANPLNDLVVLLHALPLLEKFSLSQDTVIMDKYKFIESMSTLRLKNLHFEGRFSLECLASLQTLKILSLASCSTRDEDYAGLSSLTQLETLIIVSQFFDTIGLSALSNLTKLKDLTVNKNSSRISDNGLKALGTLSSLQRLDLAACKFNGVRNFSNLSALHTLHLTGCGFYGGLQSLTNLSMLQDLNLAHCMTLQDEHLQALSHLTGLQTLQFGWSSLSSDYELHFLTNLTRLKNLVLYYVNLSINNVSILTNLTELKNLYLHKCIINGGVTGLLKK